MINTLRQQSVALVVLGLGVAATVAAWHVVGRQAESEARAEFANQAMVATSVVERRVQRYIDLLYGLDAHDAGTMVVAAGLLAVVVLLASYLPARRATRIDPVVALRAE